MKRDKYPLRNCNVIKSISQVTPSIRRNSALGSYYFSICTHQLSALQHNCISLCIFVSFNSKNCCIFRNKLSQLKGISQKLKQLLSKSSL